MPPRFPFGMEVASDSAKGGAPGSPAGGAMDAEGRPAVEAAPDAPPEGDVEERCDGVSSTLTSHTSMGLPSEFRRYIWYLLLPGGRPCIFIFIFFFFVGRSNNHRLGIRITKAGGAKESKPNEITYFTSSGSGTSRVEPLGALMANITSSLNLGILRIS
jgi:hypothetical protein